MGLSLCVRRNSRPKKFDSKEESKERVAITGGEMTRTGKEEESSSFLREESSGPKGYSSGSERSRN